jgi:hypothetical protein
MADDRYRDNSSGGGRRTSSIFSDDEGGQGRSGGAWKPEDYGWGRGGGDRSAERGGGGRGFFERARDEVGNWLGGGDDSARTSAERSRYGHGQSGFGGEHYRSNRSGADWEGGGGSGGGSSSAAYAGREQSNTSHFDENYRRWREQQIARLDQEYEEYCRERQQRFETDFHSWREARQSRPGEAQGSAGDTGPSEEGASRSAMLGGSEPGMHEAGEETTGGGDASAMESSTGSSPDTGSDGQGRY